MLDTPTAAPRVHHTPSPPRRDVGGRRARHRPARARRCARARHCHNHRLPDRLVASAAGDRVAPRRRAPARRSCSPPPRRRWPSLSTGAAAARRPHRPRRRGGVHLPTGAAGGRATPPPPTATPSLAGAAHRHDSRSRCRAAAPCRRSATAGRHCGPALPSPAAPFGPLAAPSRPCAQTLRTGPAAACRRRPRPRRRRPALHTGSFGGRPAPPPPVALRCPRPSPPPAASTRLAGTAIRRFPWSPCRAAAYRLFWPASLWIALRRAASALAAARVRRRAAAGRRRAQAQPAVSPLCCRPPFVPA